MEANSLAGADSITLPSGSFGLTIPGREEDASATGDLDILGDLILNGAGVTGTRVDGNDIDRVFHVLFSTVTINDLTIQNGQSTSYGGGLFTAKSELTLSHVQLTGNSSTSGGGGVYYCCDGSVVINNVTINFNFSNSGGGILHAQGTLAITGSTIANNSATAGGGIHSNTGTLTLMDSTVESNTASSTGGGIFNQADLSLQRTTVSSNIAASGGGLYSNTSMNVADSTFSGNRAADGAGMRLENSPANLSGVTVTGNVATAGDGGGVESSGSAALTLTNATLSGNAAAGHGGGMVVYAPSTAHLNNVTVAENTADSDNDGSGDGGGIRESGGLTFRNTVLADNLDRGAEAPECSGFPFSQGHNLIQNASGCTVVGDTSTNIVGQNANLGPLANNGGVTHTHALLPVSPAVDAGSSDCPPPATDQRGVSRPIDGTGEGNLVCDMGAVEYECPFPQIDTDSDGVGDNCDIDDDNDSNDPPAYAQCSGACPGGYWRDAVELSIGTNPLDCCADTTAANDEADDKWPPDFDDSRAVNVVDFTMWRASYASPPKALNQRADLNADGSVNILDFGAWKPYFGSSCVP
jgi:hypothetical protein